MSAFVREGATGYSPLDGMQKNGEWLIVCFHNFKNLISSLQRYNIILLEFWGTLFITWNLKNTVNNNKKKTVAIS